MAEKINQSLQMTSDELITFIEDLVDINKELQEKDKNPIAVNICGEAGLGKTSIVKQIADKKKLNFVKLNLSMMEEIGDLVGFPCKEYELTKENNSIWVSEHHVNEYLTTGWRSTNNKRMGYAPPEWILNKENGGILLLDDYTRADKLNMYNCLSLA